MAGIGSVEGYNLFQYGLNNPVMMSDPSGCWPKWLENAAKVVAVVAVVATAVVLVSAVTVGTCGLGTVALAGIAFGTACGGLVGGLYNESNGESFINGWIGGAASGFIQSALAETPLGAAGFIAGGGIGSGVGTEITENLNNLEKPEEEQKTQNEIHSIAIKSAVTATIMSAATAGVTKMVDFSMTGEGGYNSWAGTLQKGVGIKPITPGFATMLNGFFGVLDDAVAYTFWD